MEHSYILSILYEMALVIGGEISVKPLLTRMLQRMLYHTSFPAGFVCLEIPHSNETTGMLNVHIDAAVGDYELAGLIGQTISLPAKLLQGKAERTEDAELLSMLPERLRRHHAYLRLPIDGQGVVVLLAPHLPDTDLPLTQLFQPVMANLAKAIVLCRNNDAYTSGLIAERNASRQALEASEEKFRAISAAALDALIMVDDSSALVYWNPAAERILGYSAEEALGKPLHELLTPPRYQSAAMRGFDAFSGSGQGAVIGKTIEIEALHKDGREIPVELSISALKLNEHWHAVGILRDISERKHAEQELRLLAAIVESSDDAIIGKTPDGIITSWNRGAEKIYGYTDEEAIGKSVAMLAPISQRTEIDALLEQIRNGATIANHEAVRIRKDGVAIHVSLTLSPIKDAHGKITGISTIARDITVKKRMEEALLQANAYTRSLIEASLDPLVTISASGKITDVNEGSIKVTGLSREQLIGTDFSDYFTEPEKAREGYRRVFKQGFVTDYPLTIRHIDGRLTDVLYNASVYRDASGKVLGVFAAARDVTVQKHAEEELRRYKDHLEEEVQLRTADLVLARNAAEAANKAKSVFLSSMSHELRTPLNAILGFSGMMRKDAQLSGEQRENLDIINRSGEHLLTLINDVLEMAKIEAGRVQLEIAPLDLGALVRDVTDMMHLRAEEKGLRLLIDQSSEFPRYIKGDEARLRQVLINLVGNAVKFTQQGGVTLRFGLKPDVTPQRLLIEVEDSGNGIETKDLQRIFEPFVQLGQTSAQKGTGLGLTITRQFVELMGGNISVDSTPGVGSTFRVEFPVEKVDARDVASTGNMPKGEIAGIKPGQPEYRILIVEDQLENQLLLSKLMHDIGLPVKLAENGEQGIALFQSWHPDLIWMDRRMPVMDGMEATRHIRELPGGRDVKIVAVTASAFTEQRDEMFKAGMDDFVRKPYRFNEIYECLTRQLGVQYIYADAQKNEDTVESVLSEEMLANLPQDARRELRDALESLESERIVAVIDRIASHDARLHKTLLQLAENFDYPAILNVLTD